MAGGDKNPLDRAEELARGILERLGAKADEKLSSNRAPGPRTIAQLISQLENIVEANLRDQSGIKNVAPNRFKVLFTYEETSGLTPKYMEAMGKELTSAVYEYIHNRRYHTLGPISVQIASDVFAKTLAVKAAFESSATQDALSGVDGQQPAGTDNAVSPTQPVESVALLLADRAGRSYRVALGSAGHPAYAGRASGVAIHIDDPSVSRMHCSLALRLDEGVIVADLGSANGTHVNEERLSPEETRPLNDGDVLRLGDFELTVTKISSESSL